MEKKDSQGAVDSVANKVPEFEASEKKPAPEAKLEALENENKAANDEAEVIDEVRENFHPRGFVALNPIKDKRGNTAIKRGMSINYKLVEAIAKKEIEKKTKGFAEVEELIGGKKISSGISEFVESHADLNALDEHLQIHTLINDLCFSLKLPKDIKYYLSLFAIRSKENYTKSLFCAWFGALMATQLHWSKMVVRETFLLGLLHELGLLFIPDAIHNRIGNFTATEWQWYQRHPMYSKVIIENGWPEEKELARAAFLHHERGDGFGFPFAYLSDKIPNSSQMISLANYVYNARFRSDKFALKSIVDILPFIKVNKLRFQGEIYESVKRISRDCNLEATKLLKSEDAKNAVESILQRTIILNRLFVHLVSLKKTLQLNESQRYGQVVQNIADLIQNVNEKSGVISSEYMESISLMSAVELEQAVLEIQEVDILQWQLFRLVDKVLYVIPFLLKYEITEEDERNGEIAKISVEIKEILEETPESLISPQSLSRAAEPMADAAKKAPAKARGEKAEENNKAK